MIWDGRSRRWEGFVLVGVYVLAVAYVLRVGAGYALNGSWARVNA